MTSATTTQRSDRLLRAFPDKGLDIVRAHGDWVETTSGRYMDLGGASHGVALLGHNPPAVAEAIRQALEAPWHVAHTFTSPARTAFLEALHRHLPAAYTQTFMANSGTEAVECALKLAIGRGRSGLVALERSFHGRTAAALSVTHREAFRAPYAPLLADVDFVPPDVEALKAAVGRDTAAVILEPVQGEGGVHVLPPEFLRAARDITTDAGALLILDEVQTGMRSGTFLAAEQAGIVADITTLGKGLAGGLPVGTCSVTQEVAESLAPGGHGSTYGGAPLVAAAGTAALSAISPLIQSGATTGQAMQRTLAGHPAVAEVRGQGMMFALELRVRAQPVMDRLVERGVLALPAGPRAIRFLPPLNVDQDEALARITGALDG